MKNNRISIRECCTIYEVEQWFMDNLQERGLLQFVQDEESASRYMLQDELQLLEKYIDFYYELGINMEGIEAIAHLLNQMQDMKEQMVQLQNRLKLYEP
jgi:hypothetical protein